MAASRRLVRLDARVTMSGHETAVTCISWLPDDRIVTGSLDKTVRIWNSTDGTQQGTSMVHPGSVLSIVTTKDGRIISCSPKGKHMRVWNAETQELITELLPGEEAGAALRIFLSEKGGEELLVSYHQNWIAVWGVAETIQFRSNIEIQSIQGVRRGASVCFCRDSKRLAACYGSKILIVFDVESGQHYGPFDMERFWLSAIIRSPDGDTLLIASLDGSIHFWNFRTSQIMGEPWRIMAPGPGDRDIISCLSLSPDGKWLATGSSEDIPVVKFFNMKSGDRVGHPLLHDANIRVGVLAFSRTGEFIACTGGPDYNISMWRVPWWNKADQQGLDLLDVPAVFPRDDPSRDPDLDFLNIPAQRLQLPPRDGDYPVYMSLREIVLDRLLSKSPHLLNRKQEPLLARLLPEIVAATEHLIHPGMTSRLIKSGVADFCLLDGQERPHDVMLPLDCLRPPVWKLLRLYPHPLILYPTIFWNFQLLYHHLILP